MIANKVYDNSNNFGTIPEWRKIGYDDTYEDAQLLHQCMTKRLKREDDPDYDPDLHMDGDSLRPNSAGQYFQKPIFQCPECVRSYKSPVRMANHYRDKHPEKDPRSPYARFSNSQRDKRQYDTNSPPMSPDVDNNPSLPYSPFDYAHKHTRQEREREKFTANENTSQIINPYARHSPSRTTTTSTTSHSHHGAYPTALVQIASAPSSSPSPSPSPSVSPVVSPSASPTHPSSSSTPSPPSSSGPSTKIRESRRARGENSESKTITVNGRTYECKGIKISTVVDEVKFVECLEKNKQRLHLASIAYSQGLISPEEFARKQREFLNAFSFF